jgi:hypothetical protein
VSEPTNFLSKGFQLAYFLVRDREMAIQIVGRAMSRLRSQRCREKRRDYWREKHLKRKITRIVRDDGDALQWLIYLESTPYEKQQEMNDQQSSPEMMVRFLKHLVQVTTAMSSFYVNVGLHRVLHDYSTAEARRVYEWVTQHCPGPEEYRKVKGVIMNQLENRFRNGIKKCRVQHGELRFEAAEDQKSWVGLVDECLRFFTPWSTSQGCLSLANVEGDSLGLRDLLSQGGRRKVTQDSIEAYGSHMFIDPYCHGQITEKLGLEPPRQRLAVPRFFLATGSDGQNRPQVFSSEVPGLTEEERSRILSKVAEETARRHDLPVKSLTILANGIECARLDVEDDRRQEREVPEGAKLLEIWAHCDGDDFLLATHWIDYTEWEGVAPAAATVALGNGRELLLEISPVEEDEEEDRRISIGCKCQSDSLLASWIWALRSFFERVISLPRYALAVVLLIALGWALSTFKYSRELGRGREAIEHINKELADERAARASLQQRLDEERGKELLASAYRLIPDDFRVRGPEGVKEPVVSIPSGAVLVNLELSAGTGQAASYRAVLRPFLGKREILREGSLKSEQKGRSRILTFALPASLVENKQHYVLELVSLDAGGRVGKSRSFTFFVVKE